MLLLLYKLKNILSGAFVISKKSNVERMKMHLSELARGARALQRDGAPAGGRGPRPGPREGRASQRQVRPRPPLRRRQGPLGGGGRGRAGPLSIRSSHSDELHGYVRASFRVLVLGCIETKSCNQIRIF